MLVSSVEWHIPPAPAADSAAGGSCGVSRTRRLKGRTRNSHVRRVALYTQLRDGSEEGSRR